MARIENTIQDLADATELAQADRFKAELNMLNMASDLGKVMAAAAEQATNHKFLAQLAELKNAVEVAQLTVERAEAASASKLLGAIQQKHKAPTTVRGGMFAEKSKQQALAEALDIAAKLGAPVNQPRGPINTK